MMVGFLEQVYLRSLIALRDDNPSLGEIIFSRSISKISLMTQYRSTGRRAAMDTALDKISTLFHLTNPQHSTVLRAGDARVIRPECAKRPRHARLKEIDTFAVNQG
jgi:hypothetical protein